MWEGYSRDHSKYEHEKIRNFLLALIYYSQSGIDNNLKIIIIIMYYFQS